MTGRGPRRSRRTPLSASSRLRSPDPDTTVRALRSRLRES
jgi:hypothetical protein